MTRLLLMSDTHEQHDRIIGIQSADILLHAGDFTSKGVYSKVLAFSDWLDQLDNKVDIGHKVVIPGNHELTFESNWEEAAAHLPAADAILNGELYEAEGLRIWGEPRQPAYNGWAFNVDRGSMNHVWDRVPEGIDVLLTHGPPLGAGDDGKGCQYQREWILKHQPRLVVCGHIHEGYGIYQLGRTMVVNAASCNKHYKPFNPAILVDLL